MLACLQYTGGTTGVAKGAMLSHGNILANIRQAETSFGGRMAQGEEVILTALPLYHILAFTANFLLFTAGAARTSSSPIRGPSPTSSAPSRTTGSPGSRA